MQRVLSLCLAVFILLSCFPAVSAMASSQPVYLVDLIEAGQVTGDVSNTDIYRRSGCQREYASTGLPSGTPEGAVWLGTADGSTYREFFRGFRFHTQGYMTSYTFTMPEGCNTFSGTTGICWHVDSPNVGYNNKSVVNILVNGSRVWSSGPMQVQMGYDFSVHAEAGATVQVTADSVDGNIAYGHVCFGDPVLIYDPDYIPAHISFGASYAQPGTPLSVRVNTLGKQVDCTYLWTVDGSSVGTNSTIYTPVEADLEKTLTCTVYRRDTMTVLGSASLFCSRLPVLYLNTDDGADITDKNTYKSASMKLSGNGNMPAIQYNGAVQIKGRGNATWGMPKKPYHIKLNSKANLLGMGSAKHWILLANYQDECFLRNKLSMDLSGALGMEYMESRWVDVILNGRCIGNYLLCEQIRIGSTRVNITEWEGIAEDLAEAVAKANANVDQDALETQLVEHLEWASSGQFVYEGVTYQAADYLQEPLPALDGGYLLEMDRYNDEVSSFWTSHGLLIKVNRPEFAVTNSEMLSYISGYTQALENACYGSDGYTTYNGEQVHYSDLADMDSMLKWWLVQEVFFNWDAGYNSNYLYKDNDGKLIFGPIWDMDLTAGGYYDSYIYNEWQLWHYNRDGIQNIWFKQLASDPYFLTKAQEYYWIYREAFGNLLTQMEAAYPYLKESGEMNTALWYNQRGFESDYQIMHTWLENRLAWMDAQMATEASFRSSYGQYQKDAGIQVVAMHADGTGLLTDTVSAVPAQGMYRYGSDIFLHVSAEGAVTDVYLNGKKYTSLNTSGGVVAVQIPNADLTPQVGEKTVVIFYTYASNGTLLGRNDITLLEAAPTPQGLQLQNLPNTTVYQWNTPLDLTGLQVVRLWSDGTKELISDYTVTGYDPTRPGVQDLAVTDGTFTAPLSVTVLEPALVSLQVTPMAEQYPWDYSFAQADVSVTGLYADGATAPVSVDSVSAEQTPDGWRLTVVAGGLTEQATVIMQLPPLVSLEITPQALAYPADYAFTAADFTVTGVYADGHQAPVNVDTLEAVLQGAAWQVTVTAGNETKTLQLPVLIALKGDMNQDGDLSVTDVVLLRKAILQGAPESDTLQRGDLNEDGSLSVTDVVLLRKAILAGN